MRLLRNGNACGIAVCLAVFVSSCGRDSVAPSAPSPQPPPAAPAYPVVTVSGSITDAAGRPLAADVAVYPVRLSEPWYGPWGRRNQSDGSGRYAITNAPQQHDTVYVRAWKEGFVQQCAAPLTLEADTSVNLTLTPRGEAAIAGFPVTANARQISGTVYSTINGNRQPLANAWVGWEAMMDTVVADTFTDANGRYRLCGLPMDSIHGLYAVRFNTVSVVSMTVAPGGDAVIDFDVP